ncbi:hypothetical protein ACIQNG_25360 [Streptomyces sp. NPDC091377]|uniref:hypothetical protein n=1 Tax=Streptomyces sp. NPDC091377 TaxID=3365995 RepID=UPI003809EE77
MPASYASSAWRRWFSSTTIKPTVRLLDQAPAPAGLLSRSTPGAGHHPDYL